ncbi:hypothetical protein FJT64_014186 [Amphibalanus amphitrite]|uniref:Uncharacterized protein n=1 Tax=Amphibalanus amphitrite TaxID=1232801 RepID=A0A6A4V2P4_AMPAM|nr:uncharacterized protein LOC122372693 [Amphibalanus amphitrite]XP_043206140.1 uncharacterized protein LOC122372693 [Amphibalanus amphitrite]XP_043228758.1 uncharacterized protein LOC122384959 [Amphibalanus amphitrite]KAF0287389.1 hypothetical protein FJT64_014186 [Amphibalanus amphitrite]
MGGNKQANKKKQEQQKKQAEPESVNHKPKSSPKQKNKQSNKSQNECRGWSCLGKLNLLLLLAAAVLAGRLLFLNADGDLSEPGLERARARLASSWATVAALSREHGGAALQWASERADTVDRYLMDTQRPYWVPVKEGAGRAWNVTRHYGSIAGERALAVTSVAIRKTYEAASAGWAVAKPHCDTALAAVKPYWDSAVVAIRPHWDTAAAAAARGWNATATAAGPLWEAAAAQGTAVKAGVLSAAARLRQDGGPVVAEWAAAAQRAAGDAWEVVQREGPKYASAAGKWLAQSWDYVRTEGPVYATAAVEKVKKAVAGLTGSA